MLTIQVPIKLSDEEVEKAKAKGLLSDDAMAEFASRLVKESLATTDSESEMELPAGFDPLLKGIIDPSLFRRGHLLGDVTKPIEADWEACS